MVLFVSDMHFGRSDRAVERAKEADLITCLQAHADSVEHLYLVGDVFDEYIEYRYLVPKGVVRFKGLLARWTDRGIPITYLVGNHDPWHRDYFTRELGVRVVFEDLVAYHHGQVVYLAHGDAMASRSALHTALRPWLRHPVPVTLYRSLLPSDTGYGLARHVNRRTREEEPDPEVIEALRTHAQDTVTNTPADLVVMGHSHVAEHHQWAEGTYINTGNWYESRTFARLDERGPALLQWNGAHAHRHHA